MSHVFDPAKLVGFDTETHLVQAGLLAPPLVCASVCAPQGPGQMLDRDQARAVFRQLLASDRVIVGANIAYDMLVMAVDAARRGEDLMPAIFQKYARGEVFDIQIAEALHAIARGHLGKNPDGSSMFDDKGKITERYSLYTCVRLVLGRSNAKANDRFRLSYALLEDIPMAEWPLEARTYPVDDAVNTLEVALAQCGAIPRGDGRAYPSENLHDHSIQVFSAWCLHLGAAWGIRTDPGAVEVLAEAAGRGRDAGRQKFVDAGFLREDGSENQAAVKKAVAIAYGCSGTCQACEGEGKLYKLGAKGQRLASSATNCKPCNGTGLDLATAPVPMTSPTAEAVAKAEAAGGKAYGNVQTGRDVLFESGDELLADYASYLEDDKILDSYVPWLREGAAGPINLRPNAVLDTGRVSYGGVVMLLPRQISARLALVLKEMAA